MQNLSDNELDKRFKEAAENNRPPFDPGAWQNMQDRLGKVPSESGSRTFNKSHLFALLLLLTVTSGVVTWYTMTSRDDVNNIAAVAKQSPGGDVNSPTDVMVNPDAEDKPSGNIPLNTEPTNDYLAERNLSASKNHATRNGAPGHTQTSSSKSINGARTSNKLEKQIRASGTSSITNQKENVVPNNDVFLSNTPKKDVYNYKEQEQGRLANEMLPISIDRPLSAQTLSSSDSITHETPAQTDVELVSSASKEDARENGESLQNYKLSISIGVSPDFSSVNFGTHTRTGSNLALLAEYHFTNRLSIQSGAILSTKLYTATNIEYDGHNVPKADGDCRIIDIPLNLYYRFMSNSNVSFFTSAGVSSYIMKKENYDLYYDTSYGLKKYSRQVNNENDEWFKVINFSAGVSKRLRPNLFVEAEPFVKVPLSGIGDGNLNLHSLGLFLRLRYSLLQVN